jgi:hypothetical protein
MKRFICVLNYITYRTLCFILSKFISLLAKTSLIFKSKILFSELKMDEYSSRELNFSPCAI